MEKIKPLKPIRVTINFWNSVKLWCLTIVSYLLFLVLLISSLNIFTYYINSIIADGFFAQETLKYAVMLVIGSYFFLILDKNKIYDALGVKRNLPFISIEEVERKK